MGTNSELKKIENNLYVFQKGIEQNLTTILASLQNMFAKITELNDRVEKLEGKTGSIIHYEETRQ